MKFKSDLITCISIIEDIEWSLELEYGSTNILKKIQFLKEKLQHCTNEEEII